MQNDQHIGMKTNAKQRIADFLLNIIYRITERKNFSGYIQLPMTQFDISNFIGITHETVSRILHDFQHRKIIQIQNKVIYITDIDQLKENSKQIANFGQV